jgi:hypothetical protein
MLAYPDLISALNRHPNRSSLESDGEQNIGLSLRFTEVGTRAAPSG